MATQLILDFAEEEYLCVFWSLPDSTNGHRDFFIFPISEVIASCRRNGKHPFAIERNLCTEEHMRGCVDQFRLGLHECASCFVEMVNNDVLPIMVGTHPMNFISARDRR